jgi:hypothetical protein
MNEEKNEKKELTPAEKSKRARTIIIIVFAASLFLLMLYIVLPGMFNGGSGTEEQTYAPIDPDKLHEVKGDGFDIFKYDDYLKYDRNIYYIDTNNGVTQSIDEADSIYYGEGFKIAYDIINAIMHGDVDTYNSLVAESEQREDFTQQQLYDIKITKESEENITTENGVCVRYRIKVEYKIHENNGTYRNNIESDASRPQYYIIDDLSGELILTDIEEKYYIIK